MATNLQIDDKLITKAQRLGKHRTKRGAVTKALQDYIGRLEQEKRRKTPFPSGANWRV